MAKYLEALHIKVNAVSTDSLDFCIRQEGTMMDGGDMILITEFNGQESIVLEKNKISSLSII